MTLACGPDNRMCTRSNWDTRLGDHGRVEDPTPHLDHGQPKVNPLTPVRPPRTTGTRSRPTSDKPPRPAGDPTTSGSTRRLQEIHDNNLPLRTRPDDPSAYYTTTSLVPTPTTPPVRPSTTTCSTSTPDVLASLDPDRDHYQDGYWTNIEPDAEFLEEYRLGGNLTHRSAA